MASRQQRRESWLRVPAVESAPDSLEPPGESRARSSRYRGERRRFLRCEHGWHREAFSPHAGFGLRGALFSFGIRVQTDLKEDVWLC